MNQKVGHSASNPPFGIFLLIKSVKSALASPEAVKSKILGNAIYITKSDTLPASIDAVLSKSNNFLKLVDNDKKLVALELDKMRRPNYDLSQSLMDLVIKNWVNKTVFEKSKTEEVKPIGKNTSNNFKNKPLNKAAAKPMVKKPVNNGINKPKTAPIITVKKTLQLKKV